MTRRGGGDSPSPAVFGLELLSVLSSVRLRVCGIELQPFLSE
ncbi:hypothetical protein MNBD_GAMMA16-1730 [hydrothermal vent metagenome]|uniref:Uncharacterized protein n=1 Tax=hydrothermal vent metagenome TaxID=652676 RepID=A0A3B0YY86_9ZZZZ